MLRALRATRARRAPPPLRAFAVSANDPRAGIVSSVSGDTLSLLGLAAAPALSLVTLQSGAVGLVTHLLADAARVFAIAMTGEGKLKPLRFGVYSSGSLSRSLLRSSLHSEAGRGKVSADR